MKVFQRWTFVKKWMLWGLALGILFFFWGGGEQLKLGWGYSVGAEGSTRIIYRFGEVVVDRRILDYRVNSDFLVGIRLPTKDIECGGALIEAIIDQPTYFILKLDETEVTNFLSKEDFTRRLSSLNIVIEEPLNFVFFNNVLENTKRIDGRKEYEKCLRDNDLSGFRIVSLE